MKRIGVFPHTDIPFVQFLRQALEESGIECIIRNENVAVAGMMERTAQAVSPELFVVDDDREEEARRLVAQLQAAQPTDDSTAD